MACLAHSETGTSYFISRVSEGNRRQIKVTGALTGRGTNKHFCAMATYLERLRKRSKHDSYGQEVQNFRETAALTQQNKCMHYTCNRVRGTL